MNNQELLQKMKEDMEMRGFSHWTKESYVLKAKDVIKEIQSNVSKWQPIFIISSGYSVQDIEILCKTKAIHAYSSEKPMDYDELAKEIGNIANGKETKLNKHCRTSKRKS